MRRWWFLFFVVSGFCSLLYEVVWLRLAMAQFGVTTALVSIVLSIFMAGLALGSWSAGVLTRRLAGAEAVVALRLYALAELVTASSATLVPAMLSWGHRMLAGGRSAQWGSGGYYLASALCVLVALLPFCTCMGATFPLALASLRRSRPGESERQFSYLYVANVLGAALGTFLTGFVMIELLGFRGALAAAAFLNASLAALALLVSLRPRAGAADVGAAAQPVEPAASSARASLSLLTGLFLTGLVSMGMEVVWVRQFTPYLGTVVYSFSSILAVYLLSTLAGSTLYRIWARRSGRRPGMAGPLWSAAGVAGLLPLAAADPRLAFWSGLLGLDRVVVGLVPFCGVLGFLTPMLMDRFSGGEPGRAGIGYAVNVVGCLLGPLFAGFVLLPAAGERVSLAALALPLLGLAFAALGTAPVQPVGYGRTVTPLLGAVAAAVLFFSTTSFESRYQRAVVRRDSTATVVAIGQARGRLMLVNGTGMTILTPITKMMAHLPLAWRERQAQRALVICFGMGTSYRSALSWGIEATAVELVPSVPQLFGFFHADAAELLRSPRGRIVIDDGRRFLERTDLSFDTITIDPPPPVEAAGSSLLYSREFYETCQRRMSPDGILQQWMLIQEPIVASAFVKALRASFPYVRAFGSVEGWGVHLLASRAPLPSLTARQLADRLPEAAVRDLLEWGPWPTAEQQFEAVLSREAPTDSIIALAPRAPVLTDDRPVNEYFLVRRLLARWAAARRPRVAGVGP